MNELNMEKRLTIINTTCTVTCRTQIAKNNTIWTHIHRAIATSVSFDMTKIINASYARMGHIMKLNCICVVFASYL